MSVFLNWHLCNPLNSQKKLKKKTQLILVKHKRKQNFIEVENEITYGESIVNKSRAENLIMFDHFTIEVACARVII